MKTALILSGGGFQGLALLRALQQCRDTRVVVCDLYPENITRYVCHEYLISPPLSEQAAFSDFLLDTVQRFKVDVVFPATARELMALARMRDKLVAQHAVAAVSNESLLRILLDKQQAYAWLQQAGLPAQSSVEPAQHNFDTPLFGRPRAGWGGRDTVVLHRLEDLAALQVTPTDYLWTDWLPTFEEFSADFAIDTHGVISPIVLRRRLRTSVGFAVISESVADKSLADLASRASLALAQHGGRGLFNVQLLRIGANILYVSDINPRIGTSSTHALAEGLNLPGFFLNSIGESMPLHSDGSRKKVKTVRVLTDIVIPRLECKPRGVVFDLDDTLVDHKLWMLQKLEAIYGSVFAEHVAEDAYLWCARQLIDEGERRELIDRLIAGLDLTPSLRDQAIEAYRAVVVDPTPLFHDVVPTLQMLKSAGMALAILTDNPPATQRGKVSHAEALTLVDANVYAREHGAEKPALAAFKAAADALSLKPENLVMIGDNYFRDGLGAVNAGYLHALIVRREGIFISPHRGIGSCYPGGAQRIDVVDSLLSACHACLG